MSRGWGERVETEVGEIFIRAIRVPRYRDGGGGKTK